MTHPLNGSTELNSSSKQHDLCVCDILSHRELHTQRENMFVCGDILSHESYTHTHEERVNVLGEFFLTQRISTHTERQNMFVCVCVIFLSHKSYTHTHTHTHTKSKCVWVNFSHTENSHTHRERVCVS